LTKPIIPYDTFSAVDMRVGKVIDCVVAETKKPTYRLTIDFGSEIGTRISCAGVRNYEREQLLGRQVICVMNLGTKKMGPEKSEVLVLGVPFDEPGTILLVPERSVNEGVAVF
jgi:tRNA-binding protein